MTKIEDKYLSVDLNGLHIDFDLEKNIHVIAGIPEKKLLLKEIYKGIARPIIVDLVDPTKIPEAICELFDGYFKDTIILIDQVDICFEELPYNELAETIIDLSIRYEKNVILTSNSKECIDSFFKDKKHLDNIMAYAVTENKTIRKFDGWSFNRLLMAGNVDLRKAK